MIKAKAIRENTEEPQPSRENYTRSEKKKSFIPLAFLLFLTACAAYLKSFLPIHAEMPSEPSAKPPHVDEDALIKEENNDGTASAAEDDTTGSIDRSAKSADNVVPLRPLLRTAGEFLANGSPAIDIGAMNRHPMPDLELGFGGDPSRPANDNQSAGRPASEPAHVGGGGGGGSSDLDPKNPPRDPDLPRNRAPRASAPVQLQDMVRCDAYLISVLALLAGTTDPDGDAMTISGLSTSSGTLAQAEGGGWTFTPDAGSLGNVALSYYISDGAEIIRQTAYFRIIDAPSVVGTASDDNLLGTQCANVIEGRDGDDNIDARAGNDVIVGGNGDDHIVAGAGNDVIYAGAGADIVLAGTGNDVIFGGTGNDHLYGDDGDDTIYGEEGNDFISGGTGADIVFAGGGDDTVEGDDGNDTLDGGEGNDVLNGGTGRDKIFAGVGDDKISGGADDDILSDGDGEDGVHGGDGNDYVFAAADAKSDSYSGDAGEDTLDYSSATVSIRIDVGRGKAEGLDVGRDLISSFERIVSGHGDDHLIAGSTSIVMTGGDGNDTFEFGRPDDDYQVNLVRKITDFAVGDRIIARSYEIRYGQNDDPSDVIGDVFDNIYLSDDRDDRPIRFRFEKLDDRDRTFIDVHDAPGSEEFYSIELSGYHHLEIIIGIS